MTHPQGHLLSLQMRVGVSLTCRYKLGIVFIILQLYLVKEQKAAEKDKIKPIRTFASRRSLAFSHVPPSLQIMFIVKPSQMSACRDGWTFALGFWRQELPNQHRSFVTQSTEVHKKQGWYQVTPIGANTTTKHQILREDLHANNQIQCPHYMPFFISLSNFRTFSASG